MKESVRTLIIILLSKRIFLDNKILGGVFIMLKDYIWENFSETGSIDAYLLLKELEELEIKNEKQKPQEIMLN